MKVILFFILAMIILVGLVITHYSLRLGKPVNEVVSINYYHHRWKDMIIYSPMGNWFELGYTELDADPKTFVVLGSEFGKDMQTVYWRDKKQQVDVASFYLDKSRIPKDKQRVYYLPSNYADSMMVVTGANPMSYEPYQLKGENYNPGWYRDDKAIYLEGRQVQVDFLTFQRLNSALAVDTNAVYIMRSDQGKPKELLAKQANKGGVATHINDLYARVGNQVFLSVWDNEFIVLDFESIQNVSVLDELNIVINGELISRGKRVPLADVSTLEILPQDYLRDNQHVFFKGDVIPQADPTSFEVLNDDYSKDKLHVFYQTRVLPNASPIAFKINYAQGTATDGIHTYRQGEEIQ